MTTPPSSEGEARLEQHAQDFADDLQDLLTRTVSGAVAVKARTLDPRVVVEPDVNPLELTVQGEHGVDLSLWFRCCWDHQRRFLAVEYSKFYIHGPGVGEPLVRFDYLAGRLAIRSPPHISRYTPRAPRSASSSAVPHQAGCLGTGSRAFTYQSAAAGFALPSRTSSNCSCGTSTWTPLTAGMRWWTSTAAGIATSSYAQRSATDRTWHGGVGSAGG